MTDDMADVSALTARLQQAERDIEAFSGLYHAAERQVAIEQRLRAEDAARHLDAEQQVAALQQELEIAQAHAKAVAEEYRNRWQAAERQVLALRGYAVHKVRCRKSACIVDDCEFCGPCTCGLSSLLTDRSSKDQAVGDGGRGER